MIDPQTGSKLIPVNTPAGEKNLRKLAPSDWAKLGNIMQAGRKAARRAELVGLSEEEVRKELDLFDRRPIRYRDVEGYINTLEGQYAAIVLSLQKDNPKAGDNEFNELDLSPDRWLEVTAELLNLKVVTPPLPEGGGLPPPSGTSGTTPTKSGSTSAPPTTPSTGPLTDSTPPS